MLKWGALSAEYLRLLVIDEADHLLQAQTYEEQIRPIFRHLYSDIQIALFSATFPTEVIEVTKDFIKDAASIIVKKEKVPLKGIRQYYVPVELPEYKVEMFLQLYQQFEEIKSGQVIVFCNTNAAVQELSD